MSEIRTEISYEINKQAIEKTKAEIKKLEKADADLTKSLAKGDITAKEYAKTFNKIKSESAQLNRALSSLGGAFKDQESDVDKATRALDRYEDRLRAAQRGGADLSGDIASGAAGLRGVASFAGGGSAGAIGGGLEGVEAIADLGEFLPRLGAAAETLGDTLRQGTSVTSRYASVAGDAIGSVTGLSAGTSSLVAAALPAVAVLGTLAVAYQALRVAQQNQLQQIESEISAREASLQLQIQGATQAEVQRRIAELEAQRVQTLEALEGAQEAYNEQLNNSNDIVTQGANAFVQGAAALTELSFLPAQLASDFLGFETNLTGFLDTQASANLVVQQLSASEQALFEERQNFEGQIRDIDAEISQLNEDLADGEFAINDVARAEEELAETRAQTTAEIEAQTQRVQQLEQQRADFIQQQAQQASEEAELALIDAKIANEQERQSEQQHQDKLLDIKEQGQERIQELEAELNTLPQERIDALVEADKQGNEKLSELRNEFFASQIEANAEFAQETIDIEEDVAKRRKRLLEDLNNTLADASLANDVEAFLKAQRDGQQRLERDAEDAGDAEQRRVRDFIQAREKEAQVFQQKQNEAIQAINEEKVAIRQAFLERQQAIQESIETEREAIQERLRDTIESYNEQNQREERLNQLREQRAQIQERQEQERANRRIELINTEIATIQQAIASLQQTSSSQTPFRQRARTSGLFGGASNIFNTSINQTVGDVASTQDVMQATEQVAQSFQNVIRGGLGSRR